MNKNNKSKKKKAYLKFLNRSVKSKFKNKEANSLIFQTTLPHCHPIKNKCLKNKILSCHKPFSCQKSKSKSISTKKIQLFKMVQSILLKENQKIRIMFTLRRILATNHSHNSKKHVKQRKVHSLTCLIMQKFTSVDFQFYFNILNNLKELTTYFVGIRFYHLYSMFYNQQQQQVYSTIMSSDPAFDYIQGQNQSTCFESAQQCFGNIVGCFKGWCPCLGCFCCCFNDPYVAVEQGSKGLILRYNKFIRTVDPGLIYLNPITESIIKVDCRISVLDLPKQKLMTKDNISITIDSCVYYHIENPHLATYRMNNLVQSVTKISGAIIKNTVAQFTFQELLQKRDEISNDIQTQIDPITRHWGVDVDNIFLKDFGISQDLERQLVSAPVARRNAQSKIISAQGDVQVAKLLSNRSKILDSKTAIQVRYLQTIKSLGRNPASKILYSSYI